MDEQNRPRRRQWTPSLPRLSPQEATRQGAAARHAWEVFGERERTVTFLNYHDPTLDARPIDVATASEEGLSVVKKLIDDLAFQSIRPLSSAQRQAAAHLPISPTD